MFSFLSQKVKERKNVLSLYFSLFHFFFSITSGQYKNCLLIEVSVKKSISNSHLVKAIISVEAIIAFFSFAGEWRKIYVNKKRQWKKKIEHHYCWSLFFNNIVTNWWSSFDNLYCFKLYLDNCIFNLLLLREHYTCSVSVVVMGEHLIKKPFYGKRVSEKKIVR